MGNYLGPEFKVGDRVKRINKTNTEVPPQDTCSFEVGEIGEIIRINKDYANVIVEGKGICTKNDFKNLILLKTKLKFRVGDRVRCIKPFQGKAELIGRSGIVKTVSIHDDLEFKIGVSFDGWTKGHNMYGEIKDRSGRWGAEDELVFEHTSPNSSRFTYVGESAIFAGGGGMAGGGISVGIGTPVCLADECAPLSAENLEEAVRIARDNLLKFKNKNMSIVNFAKNLVLSADEKLLRKYDLKDSCGDYTEEAEEIVIQKLIKENEVYLLEVAKAKEEEANKKK